MTSNARRFASALPLIACLALLLPISAQAQTIAWTREFGTTRDDVALDAVANSTDVYIAGTSNGNLADQDQHGGGDAFLRRTSGGGAVRWTRFFSSAQFDTANSVALAGSEVVIGGRSGAIGEAFVAAYDTAGNLLWAHEFGSPRGQDSVRSVAADDTGIYAAADVSKRVQPLPNHGGADIVLERYDLAGNLIWSKEIGTKGNDVQGSVALDGVGSLYATFTTTGAVPGTTNAGFNDIVVRRYDLDGNAIWTRQFGTTSDEQEFSAVADAGGVYVGGTTRDPNGTGDAAFLDTFLLKFRPKGALAWTNQFGSVKDDYLFDLSLSGRHLFAAGETTGDLPGQTSAGEGDAFLAQYQPDGTQDWVDQIGTTGNDIGQGVGASNGRAFLVGYTNGTFPGLINHGATDAFVTKVA
jgi:hypothetical protein